MWWLVGVGGGGGGGGGGLVVWTLVPLPRQSGRHVEQDTSPLLALVEPPDPRRAVSAAAHKPAWEWGERAEPALDHSRRNGRFDRPIVNGMRRTVVGNMDRTFLLSGKIGCCPPCPKVEFRG